MKKAFEILIKTVFALIGVVSAAALLFFDFGLAFGWVRIGGEPCIATYLATVALEGILLALAWGGINMVRIKF